MGIYHVEEKCGCLYEYTTYEQTFNPVLLRPCWWHKLLKYLLGV